MQIEDWVVRIMPTRAYILAQTIVIVLWIGWNTLSPDALQFDPAWFVLLNLMFSAQASYATSFILRSTAKQDQMHAMIEQLDHQMLQETHEHALEARLAAQRVEGQHAEMISAIQRIEEKLP